MKIKMYQIDAFTGTLFAGNPAAVCPLPGDWPEDELMQNIAMENNLAETAFYINKNDDLHIRWFTPETEVDLCGHATLAAAFALFNKEGYSGKEITFQSKSGPLRVRRESDRLTMSFPADIIHETSAPPPLPSCFDRSFSEAYKGRTDYMLVFKTQEDIETLQVDLAMLQQVEARGVIVTAGGRDCDFVSRFFAPQSGIPEDPVTGSAHTTLCPYWAGRLGKQALLARQLSARGGELTCRALDDRVEISGKAVLYLTGEITV
jgi:predicted PhzF superfamily epimerase YddE/YHI9